MGGINNGGITSGYIYVVAVSDRIWSTTGSAALAVRRRNIGIGNRMQEFYVGMGCKWDLDVGIGCRNDDTESITEVLEIL